MMYPVPQFTVWSYIMGILYYITVILPYFMSAKRLSAAAENICSAHTFREGGYLDEEESGSNHFRSGVFTHKICDFHTKNSQK